MVNVDFDVVDYDKTKEDYQQESHNMNEMILRKHIYGELDMISLNRMLKRKQEIDYFIGRLDGERYKRELQS